MHSEALLMYRPYNDWNYLTDETRKIKLYRLKFQNEELAQHPFNPTNVREDIKFLRYYLHQWKDHTKMSECFFHFYLYRYYWQGFDFFQHQLTPYLDEQFDKTLSVKELIQHLKQTKFVISEEMFGIKYIMYVLEERGESLGTDSVHFMEQIFDVLLKYEK